MTDDEVATQIGISVGGSMFQTMAVVGALAEARLIDPMKVAAWATLFAENQGKDLAPEIRKGVADQLKGFASLITAMAQVPANAGRG